MNKKYKQINELSEIEKKALIKYYSNHTIAATAAAFGFSAASKNKLSTFLKSNNIQLHNTSENETIKHLALDGFDLFTTEQEQEIIAYYIKTSLALTCKKFNIKEYFVKYLLSKTDSLIAPEKKKPTAIEKKQQIELEKYGKLGLTSLEKTKITNLKKYGVENVFANSDIKEKANQTKLTKYSNSKYTNRAKAKQTCLTRYGAETYLASSDGQQKIKNYNKDKYGTDFAFQSLLWQNETKGKAIETRTLNKYTTANYSSFYLEKTASYDTFKQYIVGKNIFTIATELNVTRDHVYYLLSKYNLLDEVEKQFTGASHFETEIADYIGKSLCILHDKTVLDGQELDIYIPSKSLAIEFNGLHWHSTEINKDHNYHFNKSYLAEQKNVRLIHIYEHEWEDPAKQQKIKLLLGTALGRVKTKLYARTCEIRQITNKEARVLNEAIHLQGHRNAQITYGLYYKDKLVQLMSFSNTKYNKNLKTTNFWEIIRGCPGSNSLVVGGVGKLLKHFIREHNPDYIFSYCDFNKFNGKSYEAVGMQFIGYTKPDMSWVLPNRQVVTRKPSKHKSLKEQAIAQLFGAGSKKYLWQNKK